MEKRKDQLIFDFSGSANQAPGFINCTWAGLVGAVCTALFTILCYDIPWTEGLINSIEIRTPEGKICNAKPPAPVSMATCGVMYSVCTVTTLALSRMMGSSPVHRRHLQAVTRGAISVFNLGGMNQYGERFGTMLLDCLAGGGGAFSYKDGYHAAGSHAIPVPNIANVESTENVTPILYLYRSLITDTGGPGRQRGGISCGMAFTPHDVEQISGVLISHGTEVPNAQGLFGGLPAACTVNHMIRKTNVNQWFHQSRLPDNLDQLEGERINLGAKPGRILLNQDDVFEYTWQGGGGYGDPLDRDPEQVVRDVKNGLVSQGAAKKLYGVTLNKKTGKINPSATNKLRDTIRKRRLNQLPFLENTKGEDRNLSLTEMGTNSLGEFMFIVRRNKRSEIVCVCGTLLSEASANWKEGTRHVRLSPSEVGPLVSIHKNLEIRAYYCPGCGRQHAIEIAEKGAPVLREFEPLNS